MAKVTKPIMLNETGQEIVEQLQALNDLAVGVKGDKGDKGDPLTFDDLTPEQKEELKGEPGSQVTASETGTSTTVAKYITIDDDEYKVGGEMSKSDMEAKGMVSSVNGKNPVSGNVSIEVSGGGISDEKKKAELSYYRYVENTGGDAVKPYMKALRNATLDMEEFRKLGSGLFIHWGVYSVPAGTYTGPKVETATTTTTKMTRNCEWALRDMGIPLDTYRNFQDQFTGTEFDPEEITQMAVDCGMKYVIITAKHHEGFSLYPTNYGQWDIRESACRTTVLDELKAACDARGLKFGVYYSQYWDWEAIGGYGLNHGGKWTTTDPYTSTQHSKFISDVANQVEELVEKYEPYILWWDPGTKYNDGCQETLRSAENARWPQVITNDRLGYNRDYGDYGTGERTIYLKDNGTRQLDYGESCFTLNNTWGYSQNNETESWYYTPEKIFKEFWLYTISNGQNCLMNIGPKPDGSIPDLTKTRWNQMKTFIQNYSYGSFYNYRKMFKTTRPTWGYAVGFPDNSVYCYIISTNNTLDAETIIDGVDTTGLKTTTPIEILTPGTGATYEILDDYRIKITNLALDTTTKIGVVKLNYAADPLLVDAVAMTETYKIPMSVFIPNYSFKDSYTVASKQYSLGKGKTLASNPEIIWLDDDMYCSARLDIEYSANQTGSYITEITITDKADSTNTATLTINCPSKTEIVKESTDVFHFENGHRYTITYKTSSTSTDTTAATHKSFTFFRNENAPVTGVTLVPDTAEMSPSDEGVVYTATVTPANAANKNVTFSCENTSVTLTPIGQNQVKVVGTGYQQINTAIKATTEDGGFEATSAFEYNVVLAETVTVSPNTLTLPVNSADAATLIATVGPETASFKEVNWSTSNPAVATVANGVITTLAEGTATITATSKDGAASGTATVTVQDIQVIPVDSVSLDTSTLDLMECEIVTLNATVLPANATFKALTWESNNDNVKVVVDPDDDTKAQVVVLAGTTAGTATITAKTTHHEEGEAAKQAACSVNVEAEVINKLYEASSLSGLRDDESIEDPTLYPFSDDELNWTIFAWAFGSANPATASGVENGTAGPNDTNATLFQCVKNASSWNGFRVDADNNTIKAGTTNPAGLRPRWNVTTNLYMNPQTKESGTSIAVNGPTSTTVVHPIYLSRKTADGDAWNQSTYWWSWDGIEWNQYSVSTSTSGGIGELRNINAPLTVFYDFQRSSGQLTSNKYRYLKTAGLQDERACVAFTRQAQYKFAKRRATYDLDIHNKYVELTSEATAAD